MEIENFSLKKVKLREDKGLQVTYTEKITTGDNIHWLEKTMTSTIQRHPNIDKVADRLRIHVARMYALLGVGLYKAETEFTGKEKKIFDQLIEEVEVVGVTLSGYDDTAGAIVSAKRKVLDDQVVVMNTPNIQFEAPGYEFGFDLKETIEELTEEIFEYIFHRKFAQLELFEEEDQAA